MEDTKKEDDMKKEVLECSELEQVPEYEGPVEKVPYPKSVFFIVSNEFCERFSYYGMRTILSIYLTDMLLYDEPDAKIIYHVFTMFVYFFPIFGAMLADSLLGKFRTIFYVSIIYAIGNAVLALAATPPLNIPAREFSMLGLLLIALGTGGIKPCVSAFGGDQFVLPQQELQLAMFFSLFYFSINGGSFLSTIITPILREQSCFDQESCFSLAFGIPGILMVISIIVFGLGRPLYKIREPAGNMVVKVSKCIGNALSLKWKNGKNDKKEHWLDHAEPKYGIKLVAEIKATLKVLWLYLPLPVFWALFDQQGTGWTFQARHMDGDIDFYTILPDQMQVVNPLLILVFIPLFQYVIYPFFDRLDLLRTPLKRLVVGGGLAAVSFAISACISLAIEAENPVLAGAGNGQIRIFNTLPCDLNINSPVLSSEEINIKSLEFAPFIDIKVEDTKEFKVKVKGECYTGAQEFLLKLVEEQSVGYYFKHPVIEPEPFKVTVKKPSKGWPIISTLVYLTDPANTGKDIKIEYGDGTAVYADYIEPEELKPGEYKVMINNKEIKDITVKLGGVYVGVVTQNDDETFDINVVTVTDPNGLHMLLLIPQYVVITMAEIMFSVTGLEFSYSQAPKSMKSVMQAAWLLTTAFGNLIVVIIESAKFFDEESSNFFLYAALMVVDMLIFALMATRYKYVEKDGADSSLFDNTEDNAIEQPSKNKQEDTEGAENKGFSSD